MQDIDFSDEAIGLTTYEVSVTMTVKATDVEAARVLIWDALTDAGITVRSL